MMNEIIKFLVNINVAFVSLIIVLFILLLLFLFERNVNTYLKELYIIIFVIFSWICFYLFNDIINDMFIFNYYNIKSYLLLLIIVNIITIINVNYVKKIRYKIINYIMFATNFVIFLMNIILYFTNRFNYSISLNVFSNLMNINYIVFFLYLNVILYVYLVNVLFNRIKKKDVFEDLTDLPDEKIEFEEENKDAEIIFVNQDINNNDSIDNTSNGNFVIDGIDCSAIFDGSSQAEVMENYYILLNDVNAKLVNGYTIHEYTKIKDIINRLNIKDLSNIDLDINKLSMITYDEYNLLKNYLNSMNIKI